MGCGLMVQEQVIIDENTGRLLTDGTWTYKIPTAACIPRQLNVEFLKVWAWLLHRAPCCQAPARGLLRAPGQADPALKDGPSVTAAEQAQAAQQGKRQMPACCTKGLRLPEVVTPSRSACLACHGSRWRAQDSPNPRGVMGSKASGEPSLLLSTSVIHAVRHACQAARATLAPAVAPEHRAAVLNDVLEAPATPPRIRKVRTCSCALAPWPCLWTEQAVKVLRGRAGERSGGPCHAIWIRAVGD